MSILGIDIGQRFGLLTALEHIGKGKWKFFCDCGSETTVSSHKAISGHTKSCGCYRSSRHPTMGLSVSEGPTYNSWLSMRSRCYDKDHDSYQYYGGRGITVCQEWLVETDGTHPFVRFITDMGPRPSQDFTLDRIDGNRGYSKSNCRWSTRSTQQRNRRTTTKIMFNDKIVPLSELAEQFEINLPCLRARLNAGWDVERALSTPADTRFSRRITDEDRQRIVSLAKHMGQTAIARELGFAESSVRRVIALEVRRAA